MYQKFLGLTISIIVLTRVTFSGSGWVRAVIIDEGTTNEQLNTIYIEPTGEERTEVAGARSPLPSTQSSTPSSSSPETTQPTVVSKPIYINQQATVTITELVDDESSATVQAQGGLSGDGNGGGQVTITYIEDEPGETITTIQTEGQPKVDVHIDYKTLLGPSGKPLFEQHYNALTTQEKDELLRARKNATPHNEDRESIRKRYSISVGKTEIKITPGQTMLQGRVFIEETPPPPSTSASSSQEGDERETDIEQDRASFSDTDDNVLEQPGASGSEIKDGDEIEDADEVENREVEESDELPTDQPNDRSLTDMLDQVVEDPSLTDILDEIEEDASQLLGADEDLLEQSLTPKTTPLTTLFEEVKETFGIKNGTSESGTPQDVPTLLEDEQLPTPQVHFKPETLIASLYKNDINLEDIGLQDDIPLSLETNNHVLASLSLGAEDDYLLFSHPVTLNIPIHNLLDGTKVEVKVLHDGDSVYNAHGLSSNPNTTCARDGAASIPDNIGIVSEGFITIYTCAASTFIVTFIGGQSPEHFVDNSFIEEIIAVTPQDVYTGFVVGDLRVVVDFRSINGIDPFNPGTGNANAQQKYMQLTSPAGTTIILLASGAYTDVSNAPRSTVVFDSSASLGISGLPTSGSFLPYNSLTAFYGQDPVGDWIFTYGDTTEGDGLILYSASLEFIDTICGDGLLIGLEEACDDGNDNNHDGCSSSCEVEEGRECVGTTPSVCELIIPGLVFHIDGSTLGGSVFQDISGNERDGTGYNGVTTGTINGQTYMCFNGSNRYIEISNDDVITSYPFTVSAWIQTNDISSNRGVVSLARSASQNVMYNLEHNSSAPRVRAQNPTARYASSSVSINTSSWHHLTALYDSNTSRQIYVNGVLRGTNTQSVSFNAEVDRRNIGRFADSSPTNYFNGCIDEVRVYDRALSESEIFELYANPAALATETVYQSSPLLTGVAQGFLDRISIVVDGSSYSGINNGDGTRHLPADTITPALQTGMHTTTLIVTNPYNYSNVYTSSFTYIDPTIYVIEEVILSTGTITIILPENMEIAINTGEIITGTEQLEITTLPIEPEELLAGVEEKFEFGGTGNYLIFSDPVIIEYDAPYPEGTEIITYVLHAGDTEYNTFGLATDPSVTCNPDGSSSMENNITYVSGGKATFYTCSASTFTITYEGEQMTGVFVDGNYTGVIITVTTEDIYTGFLIGDINVIVDFWSIDGTNPFAPGTGGANSSEIYILLSSPEGTTITLLASGSYTDDGNAPRVMVTFDSAVGQTVDGLPTTGSFLPYESLSILDGQDPVGDRTFTLGDTTEGDGVILFNVSLQLSDLDCGDGVLVGGEACDDGNNIDFDGCSSSCQLEEGRTCTGVFPTICQSIVTGLQLRIDGSMTGSNFQDISGYGRHGTPFNGVTTGEINAETYMCFNGSSRYIEVSTGIISDYPFTVSARVNTNSTAINAGIVSLARSASTNVMYNLEHNNAAPRAKAQNTTARLATSSTNINTTDWFLLTARFNASNNREIYVNGELQGSNTQSATFTNLVNRRNIGRFADSSPSNYYNGCLDDVRVYDRALSEQEIYELYAKPTTLSSTTATNLSPLTGTIAGFLDSIILTISGSTYTGTNHGNGTRSLAPTNFAPYLTSGSYTTTLTVTNPYNRSAVYTASFDYQEIPAFLVDGDTIFTTGLITIVVPENTLVTVVTGEIITIDNVELTQLPPEDVPAHDRFEFGASGSYLVFSGLVILEHNAPFPDGTTVIVEASHLGDEEFNSRGIATDPSALCLSDGSATIENNVTTVLSGRATFYTCGASTFMITYTGGQNSSNFVDGNYTGKIITVTTGDVYSGFTVKSLNVIADFRSIDGEDVLFPGTGDANSQQIWMTLRSPIGTDMILLASGAYTNPANAPRATVSFDDSALIFPTGLPTSGSYKPFQPLSVYSGENPIGDRTLTFGDTTTGDGLVLFGASLELSDSGEMCTVPAQTKFRVIGSSSDRVGQYDLTVPGDLTSATYYTGVSIIGEDSTSSDLYFSDDGYWMYMIGSTADAVFQYRVETPRDIATTVGLSSRVAQDTAMEGFFFKPDGTKAYSVGQGSDRIYEYALGVPWNINSLMFITSRSIASQETVPAGIAFNASGTKMYVIGSNGDDINPYSLPTPRSIAGFTYDGAAENKVVSTQESVPTGIFFNEDGTRMWVIGSNGDDINPYTLTGAWVVKTAVYDGASENLVVGSQDTVPADLYFSPDGLKLYVVGSTNDAVYEYTLTGARSVKTASHTYTFKVANQETVPTSINFNASGTQMYVAGSNTDRIYSYYLTTPWDLSTAVQPRHLVSGQDGTPSGLAFGSGGTRMYMVGTANDRVHQYILSTPWMVSGASYANISGSVTSQDGNPQGIAFKPDGTKMYMVGSTNDRVNQYSLGSPWAINTLSYDNLFLAVGSQDGTPNGISFSPDGTRLNMVGAGNDRVYQYNLTGAWQINTASYPTIFTGVGAQEATPVGVYFSYPEICDGLDNNCDGQIDEGFASTTYYLDADGDGFGTSGSTINACYLPGNFTGDNTDCNDSSAAAYPGAGEICDGIDNDCDGEVDEGGAGEFYADSDGDGFGDPMITTGACLAPSGYTGDNTDCNDSDDTIYPGATELCDGLDNNCNSLLLSEEIDHDSDGYVECTIDGGGWDGDPEVVGGDDCDDENPQVHPATVWYLDSDGDGFSEGSTLVQCTNPGANYYLASELIGSIHASTTLADGLVVYIPFDGTADNIGTYTGTSPISAIDRYTGGKVGLSMDFSTSTSRASGVRIEHPSGGTELDLTGSVTMAAWVNLDSYIHDDGNELMIIRNGGGTDLQYSMFVVDGKLRFHRYDGSRQLIETTSNVQTGTWVHLAITRDSDSLVSLFIDGALIHTGQATLPDSANATTLSIGGRGGSSSQYFVSPLDDVRIYNRVLSADEVENLYISTNEYADGDCNDSNALVNPLATEVCDGVDNNCDEQIDEGLTSLFYQDLDGDLYGNGYSFEGCGLPASPPSNLLAYYTFDDETADDQSGNGNDAAPDAGVTYSTNTYSGTGKSIHLTGFRGVYLEPFEALETGYNERSIFMWVNTRYTTYTQLYDEGDYDSNNYVWMLVGRSGELRWVEVYVGSSFFFYNADNTEILDNEWQQFGLTIDGPSNVAKLYIDGAVVKTGFIDSSLGIHTGSSSLGQLNEDLFGGGPYGPEYNLSGYIDDVVIANRVFTDQEISQLYGAFSYTGAEYLLGTGNDCNDFDPLINPGASEITGDNVDQDCDGQEICYIDADDDGYRLDTTRTSADTDCNDSGEALATDPAVDCDDTDPAYQVVQTFYIDTDGDGFSTGASTSSCLSPGGNYSSPQEMVTASASGVGLLSGLIARFPFDNGLPTDQTTPASTGVLLDNATIGSGKVGYAMSFDGSGDAVSVKHSSELGNITKIAVSARIKTNGSGEVDHIVSKAQTGGPGTSTWQLYKASSNVLVFTVTSQTTLSRTQTGTTLLNDNQRHHVVGTRGGSGDDVRIYVDGIQEGTGIVMSGTLIVGNGIDVGIGRSYHINPGYFSGSIDDVRIYNRGLTSGEITDLYILTEQYSYGECDDTEFTLNPLNINEEICDGLDNDCDGEVDEGVTDIFYADSDGDGYGSATVTTGACTAPTGFTGDNTDCNDFNADIYPGAPEVCDGIDSACDGGLEQCTDGNATSGDGCSATCTIEYCGDSIITSGTFANWSSTVTGATTTGQQIVASYLRYASNNLPGTPLTNGGSFGLNLIELGDIDGDGVQDFAMGAYLNDSGSLGDAGSIFILRMNTGGTIKALYDIYDAVLPGAPLDAGDRMGLQISNMQDYNNDGLVDILTSFTEDIPTTDAGGVLIMSISSTGTVVSLSLLYENTLPGAPLDGGDLFGYGVTYMGDIDGDGIGDIAVPARQDDDGGNNAGAVYIVFLTNTGAASSLTKLSDSTLPGSPLDAEDIYGISMANIGDINNDGINDIAVGAYQDDDGGNNAGAVYVHTLTSTGFVATTTKISNFTLSGSPLSTGDNFGGAVYALGDLNNDGYTEIGVAALTDGDGGAAAGALYIISLTSTGNILSYQKFSDSVIAGSPLDAGDNYGQDVTIATDLDGNGVIDLIVGAVHDDDGGTNYGAAYIHLLNSDLSIKETHKISNSTVSGGLGIVTTNSNARFGRGMYKIPDLDNDGSLNFMIGAFSDDAGGTDRGAAYFIEIQPPYVHTLQEECDDGNDIDTDTCNNICQQSCPLRYLDADGDHFSDGTTTESCTHPGTGWYPLTILYGVNDCNDSDPAIHPYTLWYEDADEDGQGYFTIDVSFTGSVVTGSTSSQSYGVVAGDVDGDGDLDVYVSNYGNSKLMINNGSGVFTATTISGDSGVSYGAAMGDVNGDGYIDIYSTRDTGQSKLWINNGSGVFTANDITGDNQGFGRRRAVMGDIDGDGDLDIYKVSYGNENWLLINDGAGNFTTGTISGDVGESSRAEMFDADGDGDLDIYVTSIDGSQNKLWINDGSGNFTANDISGDNNTYGAATIGDVDGDGDLDIYVTDGGGGSPNRLWINNGSGSFTAGNVTGHTFSSFSTVMGDFDSDGDLDIYVSKLIGGTSRILFNDGLGNFTGAFHTLTGDNSTDSYGVVLGDFDGDGDLDIYKVDTQIQDRYFTNTTLITGRLMQCANPGATRYLASELDEVYGDCNDDQDTIYSGATEICDGLDNDCDTALPYYEIDDDGDGYVECTIDGGGWFGTGSVIGGDDCDDTDPLINPTLIWYLDADEDGFSNGTTLIQCADPGSTYYLLHQLLGTSAGNAGLLSGLVGYWTFDWSDGRDSSIYMNTGTLTGDISFTGGVVGNAAQFDGINDSIMLSESTIYSGWTDDQYLFMSAWVRLDQEPEGAFNTVVTYAKDNFSFGHYSGSIRTLLDNATDTDKDVKSPELITQGVWAHIATMIDADSDTIKQYYNGVLVTNASVSLTSLPTYGENLYIGSMDNEHYRSGMLDDVRIYNRLVTDNDVANIFISTNQYATGDCNDSNPNINPIAPEICDELDNDCDGTIDEGLPSIWYLDEDGDHFGTGSASCEDLGTDRYPITLLYGVDDCDDSNPEINPFTLRYEDADNDDRGHFSIDISFIENNIVSDDYNSYDVAIGDVDGDGFIDIYVANYGDYDKLWINDGSGNFTANNIDEDEGQRAHGVVMGDVDGDGDLDIYVANASDGQNKLWINNGSGDFSAGDIQDDLRNSLGAVMGDVDGDGDLDIYVANYGDEQNKLRINDGNGNFTANDISGDLGYSYDAVMGDVDGDGDLDIYVVNENAQNKLWINDGSGNFTEDDISGDDTGYSYDAVMGDVDGDGDLDIYVANFNDGQNNLWINDGSGNFTAGDIQDDLGNSFGAIMGDIDQDGDLDIYVAAHPQNKLWINDGNGNFTANDIANDASYASFSALIEDINSDGLQDIYVGNEGQNTLWINTTVITGRLMQCTNPGADRFLASELTGTTGDCNDAYTGQNPGIEEICDGIDNDCDGEIDEGFLLTYYRDADSDGYGDWNNFTGGIGICATPSGYTGNNLDCDDTDNEINPLAEEICDGIDNDCNYEVDEEVLPVYLYPDNDNDGYGVITGVFDTTLSAGGFHTCAISPTKSVRCRGDDSQQQLGDGSGSIADQHTPIKVSYIAGVKSIDAGHLYTCALKTDGTVRCRGDDSSFQLGDGDGLTTDREVPHKVVNLSGVTSIAAGGFHACALKTDGTVRCRGEDSQQALGNGAGTTDQHTPTLVVNLTGVQRITAGGGNSITNGGHSCALKDNGTIRCRGDDSQFQLGDGDGSTADRDSPFMVTGLTNAIAVSAGSLHTCAVKDDGTVRCRGSDTAQQLGNGTGDTTARDIPVQVVGLTGAIDVVAGGTSTSIAHTCALKVDGTIRCRGDDGQQALGNGAGTTDQHTPTQVSGSMAIPAALIVAGGSHSCSLKYDSTVWCRGDDAQFQIGDGNGSTTDSNVPNQVVSFTGHIQYEQSIASCSGTETGYANNGDDCNDDDIDINPGAEEVCDDIDNDCDEEIDEGVCGSLSISGAVSFNITGITTQSTEQNIDYTVSDYFIVYDPVGSNSGYYTTVALSDLTGSVSSLANSVVQRRGTGLALISGDVNTGVVIADSFTGYIVADGTNTFIMRDLGPNSNRRGIYGAYIDFYLTLPSYVTIDVYSGTITYTLYEN